MLFPKSTMLVQDAKQYYVHPEFKPYVDHFTVIYNKEITGLRVVFHPINSTTIGWCLVEFIKESNIFQNSLKKIMIITIDNEFWAEATTAQRENLIFHELGHCVLGKKHNDNIATTTTTLNNNSQIHASIMNTYMFKSNKSTEKAFQKGYYPYFLSELFNRPVLQFKSYFFNDNKYSKTFNSASIVAEDYDSIIENFESNERQASMRGL